MKHLLITGILLMPLMTLQGEEGFHIYEYPGYEGLDQIPGSGYTVHQLDRPQPVRVIPGKEKADVPADPPSDAVVLFNGAGLCQFESTNWPIIEGCLVAGDKDLLTRQSFGSFQMHVEWRTPPLPEKVEHPGNLGNSGLYIMKRYELQIFDSYSCRIYADGSAGSIYGQTPPLVNACRKPGEWQTYDIVFTAPVFEDDKLVSPARITVFHNGILIQDNTEIFGPTTHKEYRPYKPHPGKAPILIQAHDSPVAFRNIWIREIP